MAHRKHFFALEPTPGSYDVIETLRTTLQRELRVGKIRWTKPDAWVIKTHKLDRLSDHQLDELADAMHLLPSKPLSLAFWKLELIESRNHSTKIALRLTDPTATSFESHAAHFPILLRAGLNVYTRPSSPHIVLGHSAHGRSGFQADLSKIHVPQYTFAIDRITLFGSRIDPGVGYDPIEWIDLPRS